MDLNLSLKCRDYKRGLGKMSLGQSGKGTEGQWDWAADSMVLWAEEGGPHLGGGKRTRAGWEEAGTVINSWICLTFKMLSAQPRKGAGVCKTFVEGLPCPPGNLSQCPANVTKPRTTDTHLKRESIKKQNSKSSALGSPEVQVPGSGRS